MKHHSNFNYTQAWLPSDYMYRLMNFVPFNGLIRLIIEMSTASHVMCNVDKDTDVLKRASNLCKLLHIIIMALATVEVT